MLCIRQVVDDCIIAHLPYEERNVLDIRCSDCARHVGGGESTQFQELEIEELLI